MKNIIILILYKNYTDHSAFETYCYACQEVSGIARFYHEPSCVATTNYITVKPTSMFVPEISSFQPDISFFFTYRIM